MTYCKQSDQTKMNQNNKIFAKLSGVNLQSSSYMPNVDDQMFKNQMFMTGNSCYNLLDCSQGTCQAQENY